MLFLKTKKKCQKIILKDICSHYTSENRSISYKKCLYNGPNGNTCAAGRWMKRPDLAIEGSSINQYDNFKLLKSIAKKAGKYFMIKIQNLHDVHEYWDNYGLSEKGVIRVQEIKKIFEL